jgi:hypothetical protein
VSLKPIGGFGTPAPLTNDVMLLAITPDQNLIEYGAEASGKPALVEVNIASSTAQTLLDSCVEFIVISRDSHYLYAACAGCRPGNVNLFGIIKYDLVGHQITGFNPTAAESSLFLSPDGARLFFGVNASPDTGALNIEVLDTSTMQEAALITQYRLSSSIALSDDGTTLWAFSSSASGSDPETLYRLDATE